MTYRKLQGIMWALGMPMRDETARIVGRIFRDALRLGLTNGQATALVRIAYAAREGYTWRIPEDAGIMKYHTQIRNAAEHPNGKDAEDLAAAREGRPSRWGTPEFHRAEVPS